MEAALAAVTESDERLVAELADLWFASYVVSRRAASTRLRSKTSSPGGRREAAASA